MNSGSSIYKTLSITPERQGFLVTFSVLQADPFDTALATWIIGAAGQPVAPNLTRGERMKPGVHCHGIGSSVMYDKDVPCRYTGSLCSWEPDASLVKEITLGK